MADFALLESPKLISRKKEKFHTVNHICQDTLKSNLRFKNRRIVAIEYKWAFFTKSNCTSYHVVLSNPECLFSVNGSYFICT